MSTLRFTAGVGVNFSGTCGLRLVWRARKPLPCDHLVHSGVIRSSAQPARVGHTTAGPKLSTISWVPASLSKPPLDAVFSSVCLLLPFVHVALKLRSLQLHPPRCVASRLLLHPSLLFPCACAVWVLFPFSASSWWSPDSPPLRPIRDFRYLVEPN